MNFKIFGDRVLLKQVPDSEREVGGIVIPDSANKAYLMMEVVEVGDGRLRGTDGIVQRRMCVKSGERVMVQVNPMMFSNNAQKIGGEQFLALNHHDIIARIAAHVSELSISTFDPVGRWVLVRAEVPDRVGKIFLPSGGRALQSAGEVKTYFAKAGEVAVAELGDPAPGTRVMLEHSRVSPLVLDRVQCAYVDVQFIAGCLPGEVSLDHLDKLTAP